MRDLVIPAKLASTVVAWEPESGPAWLERLPSLVAEVAERWDLEVGPPLDPGGNISWVAPVTRRRDGVDAVLKLQHPHPESAPEASGLQAWAGRGAVALLDHDPERWALLIERCHPGRGLDEEGGTVAAAAAGAAIGARLHTVAPPPEIPTLQDVLAPWADELERQLAGRVPAHPVLASRALETMRTRPAATTSPVLLHGDLNPSNVLAAEREPWLAIDPKPMVGDAAYDGPRLVTQPDPFRSEDPSAAVAARLDVMVEVMGVDRDALLEWCLVGAVEMGTSAWWRGERAKGERLDAHVALLAPLLP